MGIQRRYKHINMFPKSSSAQHGLKLQLWGGCYYSVFIISWPLWTFSGSLSVVSLWYLLCICLVILDYLYEYLCKWYVSNKLQKTFDTDFIFRLIKERDKSQKYNQWESLDIWYICKCHTFGAQNSCLDVEVPIAQFVRLNTVETDHCCQKSI